MKSISKHLLDNQKIIRVDGHTEDEALHTECENPYDWWDINEFFKDPPTIEELFGEVPEAFTDDEVEE